MDRLIRRYKTGETEGWCSVDGRHWLAELSGWYACYSRYGAMLSPDGRCLTVFHKYDGFQFVVLFEPVEVTL